MASSRTAAATEWKNPRTGSGGVVDEEKKPLGIMSLTDALRSSQQRGLDLIEIASTAEPPVCRIVDYGKFRYEQAKNEKHSQKAGEKLKEI